MSISHEDIKNVYFVGAGGIGMSALERYFNSRGIHCLVGTKEKEESQPE